MKTVGKLFRTTAFKLSLAYFVLFSLGAWVVLASVGQRVEQVLDEETAQTIDAEIARLTELYGEGGLRQLVASIAAPGARSRRFDLSASRPTPANISRATSSHRQ